MCPPYDPGEARQGRASPDKQASIRHLGFAARQREHITVPALTVLHHEILHLHKRRMHSGNPLNTL